MYYRISNVNDKIDNTNGMVSLTALKKSNSLYVSSTQFARTLKGNPLLYFKFEDLKTF